MSASERIVVNVLGGVLDRMLVHQIERTQRQRRGREEDAETLGVAYDPFLDAQRKWIVQDNATLQQFTLPDFRPAVFLSVRRRSYRRDL